MRVPSNVLLSEIFRQLIASRKDGKSAAPVTDSALGERMKLSSNTVGRLRRQEGGATLDTLDAVAHEFGMEPWRLIMTADEREAHDKAAAL